jgi:hypothetical protein
MQEPIDPSRDQQQPSIFPRELDLTESNKKIKQARGVLLFVGLAQLGMGIYEYVTAADKLIGGVACGIDAFIASIFLVLALTAKKKPYISLVVALIAYILVIVAFAVLNPMNLAQGAFLKVFFTIALVKGMTAAKEAEAMKRMAGIE